MMLRCPLLFAYSSSSKTRSVWPTARANILMPVLSTSWRTGGPSRPMPARISSVINDGDSCVMLSSFVRSRPVSDTPSARLTGGGRAGGPRRGRARAGDGGPAHRVAEAGGEVVLDGAAAPVQPFHRDASGIGGGGAGAGGGGGDIPLALPAAPRLG